MTTRPVAVRVSAATRLYGSCSRQASRIASDTWSAILSGWPSVTDSEVNKKRSLNFGLLPIEGIHRIGLPQWLDGPDCACEKKQETRSPTIRRVPASMRHACTGRRRPVGVPVHFNGGRGRAAKSYSEWRELWCRRGLTPLHGETPEAGKG